MKRMLILFLTGAMLLSILSACAQETPEAPEATVLPDSDSAVADPGDASAGEEAAPVQITEVMPDNRNLVLGHEYDWVELYNPTDTDLRLDGYALTDDPQAPDAMPLTGREIPAGGYLTVVLEDTDPFGLSETGETVYLTYAQEAVYSLAFPAPQNGESFDAGGAACSFPTPGYANTEEGYYSYLDSLPQPELVISEVMSANGSYYPVGYYGYYDLIEVMNTSYQSLSLKDYYLTDKWDSTDRYRFPDVTLAPGELYVVLCSGDASLGQNHAPFGLATGDTVYLARQGTYIDTLCIPADLQYNESYGRSGNVPVYLSKPTPGSANSGGSLTGIGAPTASLEPGMYDEAVTVTLSGPGTIYYTTSGARPSTQSRVYTGPITVDGVTTIRAICVEGSRKSPVASFTYVVGQEHDLPVLVISMPESYLFGERGLHTNIEASYEYEAVMTLFEGEAEAFTIPMGIRLHGNDSRKGAKKNYKLIFRAEYGASKLNYHLFDNRDFDEFGSLLLKGGSEDWGVSMIRDELACALVDGTTELYTQAMKPVVVYLAGQYWGVHHLRERLDEDYVASHMDVSPESADVAYSSAGYSEIGHASDYRTLVNYAKTHDMSTNEAYAYLCQQINVTSLMDWYICRSYMHDTDLANIRRCRSREYDGKWHWMFFDMDWGFYVQNRKPVSSLLKLYGGDKTLINAVIASPAGRDAFLKRYAYLMSTVLNEEYVNEQIDKIIAPIESEMPRDRQRWNRTMSGWEAQVQRLRNFAKNREQMILWDIQNYFGLSDSQMEYYFGCLTEDEA